MKFQRLFQDVWLLCLCIPILLAAAVGFLGMLWIFLIMLSTFE